MKKILVKFLLIIFLALLVLPIIVLAADANPLTNLKSAAPELITGDTIYDLTGKIIQALLGFIGVLFIILIIYGGFMWMTAGGDSSKIQKAKDIIIKATIGLVIIMSSYAIVYTIIDQFSS
ncbi:MAG: hypothetical protein A3B89_04465 [Candidatus Buchananbacteria bacterium RIFCSPHIGHO2_02_FULL_40_13]|uniref:TrbC/VIRB2 family protein n=1 Tax=Candidatus Buchananbacteria bacterium RIFCSPLOWO2_01_FULL_39_33 TaxID=1797543 RepID=A0A1G1YI51_9BACT|nr:MAG: hypothetical protein A2820_00435 [Candidatus Buchananbacteria bacterium RIFCSPHIGHO2_01_FULL_40_35]OGY49055.1 MAG: hypothetical protein A3B89_04465 [Candidatus Buchananbacteria bacterium RIFCSPHIGHO2_02_FULL_40_13]OGY51496.1 MAG: hypothetical protein A3A02_03740 [Candidatus Buchananbacteria bacterium RIFCSPLOWO2_01_FULL_39_33]